MALFGFGKKKEPQPVKQPEQKPETSLPTMSDAAASFLAGLNSTPAPSPVKPAASPKTYTETVQSFLDRNPEAKQVKLTGKPEDLASYDVGDRCHVEEDDEADGKYNVTVGGFVIGRLPASAVSYAEKIESLPEDLAVIISDVEYDFDKDRDIITVYIA